ncbi:hypothetical protein [Leclercia sp. AS011]|uniref:hypothetical protein n=1 Tax=Leclercia sp. AS011 TaxID=3081257 RepID=UPI003016C891
MGVRQDGDGNYVTNARPHVQYDTESQARIADGKEKYQSELANTALKSSPEGDQVIGQAIGYLIVACMVWAIIFGLILIPGLNSAGMLVYQGGILAVPGGIVWFVLKGAYTILTVPMMIGSVVNPYDPGTHLMWQAIMMAITTVVFYKFRRKLKKPILYLTGFLALLAYISVGLVALNDTLWSAFKMFPYL